MDTLYDSRVCYETASVGELLLDSGLVQTTLENLTVGKRKYTFLQLQFPTRRAHILHNLSAYRSSGLPQQFEWSQLRSLTLKMLSPEPEVIKSGIVFLKDFHHLETLEDVTVEVHKDASLSDARHLAPHINLHKEMDYALIKFSRAQLLWIIRGHFVGRSPFEIDELGPKHFPALSQRSAFRVQVVTDTGDSKLLAVSEINSSFLQTLISDILASSPILPFLRTINSWPAGLGMARSSSGISLMQQWTDNFNGCPMMTMHPDISHSPRIADTSFLLLGAGITSRWYGTLIGARRPSAQRTH